MLTLKDERALELVRKGLLPHDAAGECAAPRWQHAAVTTDTPPHTVRAGRIPHVELSQLVLLPQLTTPEAIAAAETLVRAFVHARAQPGKPLQYHRTRRRRIGLQYIQRNKRPSPRIAKEIGRAHV